jgi:sulfur carrier protein ThiS
VRVEVRLYATFARYAPGGRSAGEPRHAGDPFDVDLGDSRSLHDLIRVLGIPENEVHLVIVNGRIVHDGSQPLQEDDRVALFPPVGGG